MIAIGHSVLNGRKCCFLTNAPCCSWYLAICTLGGHFDMKYIVVTIKHPPRQMIWGDLISIQLRGCGPLRRIRSYTSNRQVLRTWAKQFRKLWSLKSPANLWNSACRVAPKLSLTAKEDILNPLLDIIKFQIMLYKAFVEINLYSLVWRPNRSVLYILFLKNMTVLYSDLRRILL